LTKAVSQSVHILGIDVGTTGTKALLVDEKGSVLGKGYHGYPVRRLPGGRVEQDARDWWEGLCLAVRQATAGADTQNIRALSLSTQGASMLPVDEAGEPLYPAITWMDLRASEEKQALAERLSEEYIYRKTGWKANPALDAAKTLWLERHEKETAAKTASYVSTLEFINIKLTGRSVIDPTNAAIRQMMDLETLAWDEAILGAIGIDAGKLPRILPAGAPLGTLTQEAAEASGLHPGVHVYNGAHDQYCATMGAGAVAEGETALSMGTAWVLVGVTSKPLFTPSHISPAPFPIPGLWGAMASIPMSGGALDWFRAGFTADDFNTLIAEAGTRREKAASLLFYPYLAGAWFPLWKLDARAALLGMGLEHDKYDAACALMEGVAFQVHTLLDEYTGNGYAVGNLRVIGGATRSPAWLEMIASVCGCSLLQTQEKDVACLGAAMLAAMGEGLYAGIQEAADAMLSPPEPVQVEERMKDYYMEKMARYTRGWDVLSQLYP
jgi:sugar (pentulose or hexulose) kinase